MIVTITITIEEGTTVTVPTEYADLSGYLTAHTEAAVQEMLPDPATDATIEVVVLADKADK